MPCRDITNLIATTVTIVLAASGLARAAVMSTEATMFVYSVNESNGIDFLAYKEDYYNLGRVRHKLWMLREAAWAYATDHELLFPDLASDLFAEGYVTDPLLFYNDGDSDQAPTFIDNDIPNAANSALISYEFPGAGLVPGFPTPIDAVLFRDNSASNNAGLGKFSFAWFGFDIDFEPADPRTFSQISTVVTEFTPATLSGQPYFFNNPPDTQLESISGPHRFDLSANGTVTQDVLDIFEDEGFSDRNLVQMTAVGAMAQYDLSIIGTPSSNLEVSAYMMIDALLSIPAGSDDSNLTIRAKLSSSECSAGFDTCADRRLTGNPYSGFGTESKLSIIDRHLVEPGDPRYVAGATTLEMKLVAHLPVLLDTSIERGLGYSVRITRNTDVDSNTVPGDYAGVSAQVLLPLMPSGNQIKLYVPQGYSLSMNSSDGPNDVIVAVNKGDMNLDGVIGIADQSSLIASYSRPIGSSNYFVMSFDRLATFDFDGDGDIDCKDHQKLLDEWGAGGSPTAFAECDNDFDADGIPNGDDDCPGTPTGKAVNDVGCPLGDYTLDGVFNMGDIAGFADCQNGPNKLPNPAPQFSIAACQNAFDIDGDKDVDLADYALLLTY